MALQSIAGWILFLVFGGWGLLAAPLDWMHEYVRRPKTVITKSQYLERARLIAQRAREARATGEMLKRQDRAAGGSRPRAWRSALRNLQRDVVALEQDERLLDDSFPRGADGEAKWVLLQLTYLLTLLGGVVGLGVSLMWVAHVIVYLLPPVPVHPLLNEVFQKMDAVFPLFGVAFFAMFTFYLLS
jgi:LMBR1 domain-containing protein 1